MKTKTWLNKKIQEIDSWGQLMLFSHLKERWDHEMSNQRNIIFSMGTLEYEGSNLETHDLYVEAVNKAWDREFGKLYSQIESSSEQNNGPQKIHQTQAAENQQKATP